MPSFGQTIALIEGDHLGLGAKGTTSGMTVVERGNSIFRASDITFASTPIPMTYNGTVNGGSGSVLIYTEPVSMVSLLGAVGTLTLSGGSDTNCGATAAAVISVGTTAAGTNNSTLTTTEANLIASTADTFTARAGSAAVKYTGTEFAAGVFDGSSTANAYYVNVVIPPAGISAACTLTLTGTLLITRALTGGLASRPNSSNPA